MTIEELKDMSKDIIENAEKSGKESAFLFTTTLDRYIKQIETMQTLEEIIEKEGVTVTKEYIKGVRNICVNPALKEYNNMIANMNKTATILLRMNRELDITHDVDPLLKLMNC